MKTEERRITSEPLTLEEREGKLPLIKGYAVVFGQRSIQLRSQSIGSFVEVIDQRAFDGCDMADVVACVDHDESQIIGRSTNGTLTWEIDSRGLLVTIDPPNTTTGRDIVELIRRGDVRGQSFAFVKEKDEIRAGTDGVAIRTIKQFATVRHITPVVRPAYPDTDVALRSIEAFQQEEEQRQAAPAVTDKPDASGLELAQKRLTLYCRF